MANDERNPIASPFRLNSLKSKIRINVRAIISNAELSVIIQMEFLMNELERANGNTINIELRALIDLLRAYRYNVNGARQLMAKLRKRRTVSFVPVKKERDASR